MVSVILPVYNGELFLERTINQILNQTYKDFELIIIDDGSIDNSSEICKRYCDNDNRIRYYRQNNQGISASRNNAMSLAKGKYISFIDQDDDIDKQMLEVLVNLIEENEADVAKIAYRIIDVDIKGQIIKNRISSNYNGLFEKTDVINDFSMIRDQMQSVWNCLYKKQIINDSNVIFDTRMMYGGEDIAFNVSLIPYVNKIASSDYIGYFHYKRMSTSTSAKINNNRIESIALLDSIENKIILSLFRTNQREQWIISERLANLCLALSIICQSAFLKNEEKKRYIQMMRKKQYFEIEIKNMNNMVFLLRKYNKRVVAAMLYKYKFDNILIKLTEARAEK